MSVSANSLIEQLLGTTSRPCLSLYLSTHRTQPERRDDQTHYRLLVRTLSDSLSSAYKAEDAHALIEPFMELAQDEDFWNARKEGVAVFCSPGMFIAKHLDRTVPDIAIVADSFHMKPLLRNLQTLEAYHVLAITRERAWLYLGDRDGLHVVDLGPDVPMTINDALGSELTERHFTHLNSGGMTRTVGHSTKQDEIDLDTERFFRAVDKSILEHASHPSGLPLILAGLPDQLSVFHSVSHNPNILLEGVTASPDGISHKELVKRAWEIMVPYVHAESIRTVEAYREAAPHNLGLDHVVPIAHAAIEGRIATLMVEAQRQVPGKIDSVTGEISFDDLDQPDINDVLDDLAVLVLKKGGKVLVLASEHMPTATGAAAILRY